MSCFTGSKLDNPEFSKWLDAEYFENSDVGNIMMIVGDIMLVFSLCWSVTNIANCSLTSETSHQHKRSSRSVTNIDATEKFLALIIKTCKYMISSSGG